MGIKLRKHGTVTATFATAQQVDISHANDSVRVGDGTDLMGPLQNVGGVLCFPVKIQNPSVALDATLTGGTQRSKITDGTDNVGIETVGIEKALKVAVISTVGGGAAPAFTDDAAFTVAVTQVTPIGALCDEVATDSVDEGDVGAVRMTANRLLMVHLKELASGLAIPVTDNGGSLTVDGTFWQATQPVSAASLPLPTGASTLAEQQSQTTHLATIASAVRAEDDASADLHKGIGLLAIRKATPANTSGLDGDYEFLQMSAGRLWASATIDAALPAGANAIGKLAANTGVDIGDVDVTSLVCAAANAKVDIGLINAVVPLMGAGNTGTGSLRVTIASDQAAVATTPAGNVAHDAVDAGNPLKVGGQARSTNATRVADADRVNFIADLAGRQVTVPHQVRELVTKNNITLSTTTETTLLAAAASTFHDLVFLMLTNTSSTAVRVDFRDTTLGTVLFSVGLAANGGAVIPFPVAVPQTTVNTNWTAQLSAAVTDVRILAIAVKNI